MVKHLAVLLHCRVHLCILVQLYLFHMFIYGVCVLVHLGSNFRNRRFLNLGIAKISLTQDLWFLPRKTGEGVRHEISITHAIIMQFMHKCYDTLIVRGSRKSVVLWADKRWSKPAKSSHYHGHTWQVRIIPNKTNSHPSWLALLRARLEGEHQFILPMSFHICLYFLKSTPIQILPPLDSSNYQVRSCLPKQTD